MKINARKLKIAMARACINPCELCRKAGIDHQTYLRTFNGLKSRPATVGKIAKALNIDMTEILEDE